jgi:tetratricopeptide (TPR) repeat protein
MKKQNIYTILFIFVLFCMVSRVFLTDANASANTQPGDMETGIVIEKVVCQHDANQSYGLYIPKSFSPASQRKWPVLFAFDPGGRAALPPKLFKTAAEKYNIMVVCPANCKNGPRKPTMEAMKAVWKDFCDRFPVDKQRIYAAGFSGGSRMSSFFSFVINNPVQGIIGCGAGLSPLIKPEQIKPTTYYGIVGFADFNYIEMLKLDKTLDQHGIRHRFVYFNAKHRWPPETICERAVAWMELQAIRKRLTPRDDALIKTIFETERQLAKEREASADIYFAAADYESTAVDFEGLLPAPEIEKIRQESVHLKNTKLYKKFQNEELIRHQKETNYMKKFVDIFAFLKHTNPREFPLKKVMMELGIRNLVREVIKKKNIYDAGLAERLLYNLANQSLRQGDEYLKNKDYTRAAIFLEIGDASGKFTWFYPNILYNLSCVFALQNKTKKALKYLQQAVDNGFIFPDYIEKDKDLETIQQTPQFKAIIQQLKSKVKEAKEKD